MVVNVVHVRVVLELIELIKHRLFLGFIFLGNIKALHGKQPVVVTYVGKQGKTILAVLFSDEAGREGCGKGKSNSMDELTSVGESALLDCIVGKLFEDFYGLILSPCTMEGLLRLFEAIILGQPIGVWNKHFVLELRLQLHEGERLVPTMERDV